MLPTGDVGDWCAEIHQVWRSLALQTTVDSRAELVVDQLIMPVILLLRSYLRKAGGDAFVSVVLSFSIPLSVRGRRPRSTHEVVDGLS